MAKDQDGDEREGWREIILRIGISRREAGKQIIQIGVVGI